MVGNGLGRWDVVRRCLAVVVLTGIGLTSGGCGAKVPTAGELIAEVAPGDPVVEPEPEPRGDAAPVVPQGESPTEDTTPDHEKGMSSDDERTPRTFEGWLDWAQTKNTNSHLQSALTHPDAVEKMTSLDVKNSKGLTDAASAGLEKMVHLERLTMTASGLEGGTLGRASHLPDLVDLNIRSCTFQTRPELAETPFPRLERLSAGDARLTRDVVIAIARMSQLKTLSLGNTELTGEAVQLLKPLMNLEELDLSSNKSLSDSGLHMLVNLRKLRVLNLARTAVKGPALWELTKAGALLELQSLDLTGAVLSDEMAPALLAMTKLENLQLNDTTIRDRGLTLIPQLKSLKVLGLRGNRDMGMSGMPALKGLVQLEELDLSKNGQLTNDMLPVLVTLKGLRLLNLIETGCTGEGISQLRIAMPTTKIEWVE
jgi:hypothetical protein